MEDSLIDAATADLLVRIGWHVAGGVIALGAGVIGTLLWGKGGRKRLVVSNAQLVESNTQLSKRVAALEAENRMPSITQIVNVQGGTSIEERERHLRNAIAAETVQNLEKTIRSLDQKPLSDGNTYASLPDGTNIVSMADGSYRLALPIRLSVSFRGEVTGSASLSPRLKKGHPIDEEDEEC